MLNKKTGLHIIPSPPPAIFSDRQIAFAKEMEDKAVQALAAADTDPAAARDLEELLLFLVEARRVGLLPPLPEP